MSSKTQFTILTDRSHGGASLKEGSLELMVCPCVTVCVCLSYLVLSSVYACLSYYVLSSSANTALLYSDSCKPYLPPSLLVNTLIHNKCIEPIGGTITFHAIRIITKSSQQLNNTYFHEPPLDLQLNKIYCAF